MLEILRAAARAKDIDVMKNELTRLDASCITDVFQLSFTLQQTNPKEALLLLDWIIDQPRPSEEYAQTNWLRAHNNACFLFKFADPDMNLRNARRALAVAGDNVPVFHNVACVFCKLEMAEEAMEAVRCAVAHGYEYTAFMFEDSELDLIRRREDFRLLVLQEEHSQLNYDETNIPENLQRIQQKLDRLKCLDREHNHIMWPRLQDSRIEVFEKQNGIRLPEDYRNVLQFIGNGGISCFEIFRLEDVFNEDRQGDITLPFPLKTNWKGEDGLPENFFPDGLITITRADCGCRVHLIVSGESRGQIWYETSDNDWSTTGEIFVEWFENQLDERISELEQAESNGSSSAAPQWASFWSDLEYMDFLRILRNEFDQRHFQADLDSLYCCGVVRVNGSSFGMTNLSRRCRDSEPDTWSDIVSEYFTAILYAAPTDPVLLRSMIKVRLYPQHFVEHSTGIIFKPYAEGLVLALTIDLPDRVETLSKDRAAAFELTREALYTLGIENLKNEPKLKATEMEGLNRNILILEGESFFSASHFLRFSEYIDIPDAGMLVAIPNRHTLMFAPLNNQIHEVLNQMIVLSHDIYASEGGPLTPHPYLYKDQLLSRIMSGIREDGQGWCAPPEALIKATGLPESLEGDVQC